MRSHVLLASLVLSLALSPSLLAKLTTFQATYAASTHGIPLGKVRKQLICTAPNRYEYLITPAFNRATKALLKTEVKMRSTFELHGDTLTPQRYHYQSMPTGKNTKKQKHYLIQYGSEKSCELFSKRCWSTTAGERSLYDPISLEIAYPLALSLHTNRHTYPVLMNHKGVKMARFETAGTESIQVPAGQYQTLKIRMTMGNKERVTTLWLAPTQNYLPVKIIQKDHDKTVTFVLQSYRPDNLPNG